MISEEANSNTYTRFVYISLNKLKTKNDLGDSMAHGR